MRSPDLNQRVLVPPYQRTPEQYLCAQCGEQATGFHQTHGVLMFSCEDHGRAVVDVLWAITGADGSSGYDKVRVSWRYWVQSHLHVARRRVVPHARREWKRSKADYASAEAVFNQARVQFGPTTWGLRNVRLSDEP